MFKAIARYILRNELTILNEDIQIEKSNATYHFHRGEAYKAEYHKLLWKRSDEELQQIEEIKKERAKLALWANTSEFDEF